MDRLLSRTTIAITGDQDSKNVEFLKRYYEEYFAPLAEIVIGDVSDFHRDFLILSEGDIYLEALDIRANLRICEEYDAATGYDHVIDLTHEQAQLLRKTNITRGIDITNHAASKNTALHFFKRGAPPARIFHSPNHALRLPRD
jgi:hypothetical protein